MPFTIVLGSLLLITIPLLSLENESMQYNTYFLLFIGPFKSSDTHWLKFLATGSPTFGLAGYILNFYLHTLQLLVISSIIFIVTPLL